MLAPILRESSLPRSERSSRQLGPLQRHRAHDGSVPPQKERGSLGDCPECSVALSAEKITQCRVNRSIKQQRGCVQKSQKACHCGMCAQKPLESFIHGRRSWEHRGNNLTVGASQMMSCRHLLPAIVHAILGFRDLSRPWPDQNLFLWPYSKIVHCDCLQNEVWTHRATRKLACGSLDAPKEVWEMMETSKRSRDCLAASGGRGFEHRVYDGA